MFNELIGLLFIVFVIVALFTYVYSQHAFYKLRRRNQNLEPDLLEAALLKKDIAEGKIVKDVAIDKLPYQPQRW